MTKPEFGKWQPIDTAPSDIMVLLFSPNNGIETRVYHSSRGGWQHAWATYWMPIPKPPNEGAQ